MSNDQPLTVAVVNDYEVIVRGVAAMLARFPDRIRVVELAAGAEPDRHADLALFDTFAGRRHALDRAAEMVAHGKVGHVVLYTWDAAPEFVRQAHESGVAGVVSKAQTGQSLVQALERIARGERLGFGSATRHRQEIDGVALSDRESEVLALIALGLTNAEMADELYLSAETIKTYIKRLYAKLGVRNRAQATVRAVELGLQPPEVRRNALA